MFKIDIAKFEVNCHVFFPRLGGTDIMDKLETLGETIMGIEQKVIELEAELAATLASVESAKTAVAAEAAQVKARLDELIAQIGGITPGSSITEAKLDEILVKAKAIRASADGLTTAIDGIYVPGGVINPPVPGTLATDLDGNFIAVNGDIVKADGTVRYAVGSFTTDPAGHHLDMVGNTITPSSIP